MPEPNILESRASRYLVARCSGLDGDGRIGHGDLVELDRIRRRAVVVAVISGLVSGAVIGGTEAWLRLVWQGGIEDWSFRQQLPYWVGFFAFTGVVTVVEMAFLYWNALKAVAGINSRLGISLDRGERAELLAIGLARAALESPNPHHVVHGVDPYALMPRWRLVAQNLLYKVKVGASSFIIRILMRRLFARAALRGFIPLLAIPLYAVWNAWITWRIVDEARLRVLGPGAIDTAIELIRDRGRQLDDDTREAILHGVGEIVMRGYDAHPNYIMLVRRLVEELAPERREIDVDWESRKPILQHMSREDMTLLLDVLTLAAVLAGRPRRAQRKFLEEVHRDCGRELNPKALKSLGRAFTRGHGVGEDELCRVRSSPA